MNNHPDNLTQLKSLGRLLDTKFQGPFGTKFGLDALIGLIPGIGDFVTSALSLYIIARAAAMGVGSSTLMRMAMNVVFENVIDMIPFVGNLFDFYWKANTKNMILLERHLTDPARETIKSRTVVGLVSVILILILVASGYISWVVLKNLFTFISSYSD